MSDLVQVSGLSVEATNAAGETVTIVNDVSFSAAKGDVLALIGESGSGKTTIALALMGHVRDGCRISGGSVQIDGEELTSLDARALRRLRGRKVAYIAQSAASAFNPSRTILDQVIEAAIIHGLMTRAEAKAKAVGLFAALQLPDPDHVGQRYPHQVSGGQLQRLMAAMALITDPALVILDEPTTALDVTTQLEVLRVFKAVVRARGATAVYVSHDLSVVAQMADQVVVLSRGQVREIGATDQILQAPRDAYTRTLVAAARPAMAAVAPLSESPAPTPLLEVRGLTAGYGRRLANGVPAHAVLKAVDLRIERGGVLGVIGESGSGKSTLARVIAGLVAPSAGMVLLNGEPLPSGLAGRSRDQFRRIQIVFQNADTALNPAHIVSRVLGRPLAFYHGLSGPTRDKRITELLALTRLPADIAGRRVGELSGGQKQRINLARALAAEPDLILCDEVTSALDTVVGAAILELLADLRRELGLSLMFISHDITTVRAICDDIVVLYAGRKVEAGPRRAFVRPPFHPYTNLLIASTPELRSGWLEAQPVAAPPPGIGGGSVGGDLCAYLARCPVRVDGLCNSAPPPKATHAEGGEMLCHRTGADLERLQARRSAKAAG